MTVIKEDHNHSDTEMSHEAKELVLHGDNTEHLYRSSTIPIRKNLNKKFKKGVYDHEKSKKLWGYHADRAAQSYTREHGHPGQKWHEMFKPKHRKQAAAHWADEHHEAMMSGDQGHMHEDISAEEIVLNAMGKKPLDVNTNFKEAVLERALGLIDEKKGALEGNFAESFNLNPAKKGMFNGVSTKTIQKDKTKAKASGNVTKEREDVFAMNARHHWNK